MDHFAHKKNDEKWYFYIKMLVLFQYCAILTLMNLHINKKQNRTLCVKCSVDGELSPKRKAFGLRYRVRTRCRFFMTGTHSMCGREIHHMTMSFFDGYYFAGLR